MHRRCSFAVLTGAVVLASANVARATPSRVALRLSSPAGCMDASVLASGIDGILSRAAVEASPTGPLPVVDVVLSGSPASREYRAVLSLETPDGRVTGSRELVRPGSNCHVLDGPLVVVAALLVDAAEESVRLTLPPIPPPPELPISPPVPPSPMLWRIETDLGASLLLGLTPPAIGARVGLRATPPGGIPLLLRMEGFPAAETSHVGANGAFVTMTGTLAACPERVFGRASATGCLGVLAGVVHAAGENVPIPGDSDSPVVMGLAELGASVRAIGPVALAASVAVAVGQRPPNWHVDGPDGSTVVVWTPWPVTVVAALGLSFDTASEKHPPTGH